MFKLPFPGARGCRVLALVAAGVLVVCACSPALDWREMRPEGWSLVASLPCRPAQHARTLALAGQSVELGMAVCSAQGHTFAVSSAAMADPSAVGPALQALGEAARGNLAGQVLEVQPAQVPGMTPQAQALRWRLAGHLPDGQPVQARVLVFAHGLRVFQATVVGPSTGDAQWQPFVDGLRLAP